MRWCVKAPLAYRGDKKLALTNGTTESELDVGTLFSTLHLSVLQVRLLPLGMFVCPVNTQGKDTTGIVPFLPLPGLLAAAHHSE